MLPDRVSNPGPLTYESGALPIALRGPPKVVIITNWGKDKNQISPKLYSCFPYVVSHNLKPKNARLVDARLKRI